MEHLTHEQGEMEHLTPEQEEIFNKITSNLKSSATFKDQIESAGIYWTDEISDEELDDFLTKKEKVASFFGINGYGFHIFNKDFDWEIHCRWGRSFDGIKVGRIKKEMKLRSAELFQIGSFSQKEWKITRKKNRITFKEDPFFIEYKNYLFVYYSGIDFLNEN